MTYAVTHYNFMTLLRDYGYTPAAHNEIGLNIMSYAKMLVNELLLNVNKTKQTMNDETYDFMDLLRDNGFVPAPSNDNEPLIKIA